MFIICNIIIFNLSMICLIRRINHLKYKKDRLSLKFTVGSFAKKRDIKGRQK